MKYFIKVSIMPRRQTAYFRAQDILSIAEGQDNPLETVVVCLTPSGAKVFPIAESPCEVAEAVENCFKKDSLDDPVASPLICKPAQA